LTKYELHRPHSSCVPFATDKQRYDYMQLPNHLMTSSALVVSGDVETVCVYVDNREEGVQTELTVVAARWHLVCGHCCVRTISQQKTTGSIRHYTRLRSC